MESATLAPFRAFRVPRRNNEIVLGKRSITADTALRIAKAFGTSEGWLRAGYDLDESRKQVGAALGLIERLAA